MLEYRRGDVWLASLDPVVSSETGKTRPVLIIQNDIANEFSLVVIVAALTGAVGTKDYPTEVRVRRPEGGPTKASVVLLNQIRTLDKRRLVECWGCLEPKTMQQVDEALRISVGLVPL